MTDRAPVFNAIRDLRGKGFEPMEVAQVDDLLDRLGIARPAAVRLGALSEKYESGGRGPGTVSSGVGDPGGVSYGLYQLASKTGSVAAFLAREGAAWPKLKSYAIGTAQFSAEWKAIAARQPQAFGDAQHAFIERTHYAPVVAEVRKQTGLDCDAQPQAVRDAVWSCAVQHGKAAQIVVAGIHRAEAKTSRGSAGYARALVNGIYDARAAYVTGLLANASGGTAQTFRNILANRYPDERARALAALA